MPLEELSDPQLALVIAGGDREALAEAFRRHAGAVFGLARRVSGDAEEAQDVTQEVFLRLWDRPDRFDAARGSLRTFLLTTTHGRAVDVLRSRNARAARETSDGARANAAYSVDLEMDDLVMADQVNRAMASLPNQEREAIELAYFDGHTYREVAHLLSEPEGTIKTRIRNGLRRMRTVLTDGMLERKADEL